MKKPLAVGDKVTFYGIAHAGGNQWFYNFNTSCFYEVVMPIVNINDLMISINNDGKIYEITRRQVVKVRRKKAKPVPREFWIKCVPNKEYDLIGIVDALDEKRYPHTIKVREVIP